MKDVASKASEGKTIADGLYLRTRPGTLIARYAVVIAGALLITAGLLLFMQHAVDALRQVDPLRYFAVADFISAPDGGRRLPKAPPKPEAQPSRPGLSVERSAEDPLEEDAETAAPDLSVAPTPVVPGLEPEQP